MAVWSSLKAKIRSSGSTPASDPGSTQAPASRPSESEATDTVGAPPDFTAGTTSPRRIRSPSETGSQTSVGGAASLRSRPSNHMLKMFGTSGRRRSQIGVPGADASRSTLSVAAQSPGERTDMSGIQSRPGTSPAGATESRLGPSPTIGALPGVTTPTGGALLGAIEGIGARTPTGEMPPAGVTPASPAPSAATGPKPSELFAGKGIQWGAVDLTGSPGSTGTGREGAQRTEDLQSFLKARRQWIPTFKTEENPASDVPTSVGADGLPELAPASNVASGGGLMSLADLEEAHRRKKQLFGDLAIEKDNGALFNSFPPLSTGQNSPSAPASVPARNAPTTLARSSSLANGSSRLAAAPLGSSGSSTVTSANASTEAGPNSTGKLPAETPAAAALAPAPALTAASAPPLAPVDARAPVASKDTSTAAAVDASTAGAATAAAAPAPTETVQQPSTEPASQLPSEAQPATTTTAPTNAAPESQLQEPLNGSVAATAADPAVDVPGALNNVAPVQGADVPAVSTENNLASTPAPEPVTAA